MNTASPPAGDAQAENLLGALGVAVADRIQRALDAGVDLGPTAAAALSALDQFLGDPTIDLLRQVLGLTPSGTVRLVDRLVQASFVLRAEGPDRRSVAVTLTPAGRRAARRVTEVRQALLAGALAPLEASERRQFADLAGRILTGLAGAPDGRGWMCRLCDLDACGRAAGHCPVAGPHPPSF